MASPRITVAPFITTNPQRTRFRVFIERRGFKARKMFDTFEEAVAHRDEQLQVAAATALRPVGADPWDQPRLPPRLTAMDTNHLPFHFEIQPTQTHMHDTAPDYSNHAEFKPSTGPRDAMSDKSEIKAEIELLADEMQRLSAVAGKLIERLGPVLSIKAVASGETPRVKEPEGCCYSPLGKALAGNRLLASNVIDRLRQVTDSLAI